MFSRTYATVAEDCAGTIFNDGEAMKLSSREYCESLRLFAAAGVASQNPDESQKRNARVHLVLEEKKSKTGEYLLYCTSELLQRVFISYL